MSKSYSRSRIGKIRSSKKCSFAVYATHALQKLHQRHNDNCTEQTIPTALELEQFFQEFESNNNGELNLSGLDLRLRFVN